MMHKLFKIGLAALVATVVCTASAQQQQQECPLIPKPVEAMAVDASFTLDNRTAILYDEEFAPQAQLLQGELLAQCGISPILNPEGPQKGLSGTRIVLQRAKKLGEEAYMLHIDNNIITLQASERKGMINATMSLLQLARLAYHTSKGYISRDTWNPFYYNDALNAKPQEEKITLQGWHISDSPRFSWRGFMLDEARHFFGKKKVKQLIDYMALYKLNRLHWHLSDEQGWRVEIKAYPKLALIGGIGHNTDPFAPTQYYTQDEVREIVAYAYERGIEILPEIDMPGHATAMVKAYPEFSGGAKGSRKPNYTLNPGKEELYYFINRILKEVDALFPFQTIHIGGDELKDGNSVWNDNADIQALMKRENLTSFLDVEHYFAHRVADSLFQMNNRIAAWDELAGLDLPNEKTIIYAWRTDKLEMLRKAVEKDYNIVFSPRKPMYFDYAQDSLQVHGVGWKKFGVNSYRKVYDWDYSTFDVDFSKGGKILGIQANMWTERVDTPDRLDYLVYPRIIALAENAWTAREQKDIENFDLRLKEQFRLLRADDIYFNNPFDPTEHGEPPF